METFAMKSFDSHTSNLPVNEDEIETSGPTIFGVIIGMLTPMLI